MREEEWVWKSLGPRAGIYTQKEREREREDGSVGDRASRKELVKRRLKLVTRLEELKKDGKWSKH